MSILVNKKTRVICQGITGKAGAFHTKGCKEYGTNIVGGVTPGKGGQTVLGVPVFNTPQDAAKALGNIDISVLFVPAAGVKDAAIAAIEAGIKLTVLVPDPTTTLSDAPIAATSKIVKVTTYDPEGDDGQENDALVAGKQRIDSRPKFNFLSTHTARRTFATFAYMELKMQENVRFEHTPHPVEYDMYYSS